MPLYNDLEVRPRYGSALPSYAPEGARLEAPPVDMNQIIGEAALSGALSSIPLAPTYEGLLAATQPQGEGQLVFRGIRGERVNPLAHWRGKPNIATENPYVGHTYTTPRRHANARLTKTSVPGEVYPIRVFPDELVEVGATEVGGHLRPDPSPPPGTVWTRGNVTNPRSPIWHDPGGVDPEGFWKEGSRQTLWGKGTRSMSSGKPLGDAEVRELWKDAARRIDVSPNPEGLTSETKQRILKEILNDPRFEAPLASRVGLGLRSLGKGLVKGLVSPLALLEGALLAGPVSGLAGGAGYASAAPESAGLFTPPGPGYEGLVTAEDIEAAAEARELLKEQERQRLLEQYRASGYDLDPNTRLRDLR